MKSHIIISKSHVEFEAEHINRKMFIIFLTSQFLILILTIHKAMRNALRLIV